MAPQDVAVPIDGILARMRAAEAKAWAALAGYKFWMFDYHAARWVNDSQLLPRELRPANPFRPAVHLARELDPRRPTT